MGASRPGYDLFTKIGWYHIKVEGWPGFKMIFEDTFYQTWCWIFGHKVYNAADLYQPVEWACRRCHKYIPRMGK